jgi:very-short-patch-repair endonuclease
MSLKQIARLLRREQTDEEKQLWRALRGRRFAGFKFRRQHTQSAGMFWTFIVPTPN